MLPRCKKSIRTMWVALSLSASDPRFKETHIPPTLRFHQGCRGSLLPRNQTNTNNESWNYYFARETNYSDWKYITIRFRYNPKSKINDRNWSFLVASEETSRREKQILYEILLHPNKYFLQNLVGNFSGCQQFEDIAYKTSISPTLIGKPQIIKTGKCPWEVVTQVSGGVKTKLGEFAHMVLFWHYLFYCSLSYFDMILGFTEI